MSADLRLFDLLQRSVVVTGTHYAATTVVGSLLATAPEFHMLHEPLNPEPTRSYDSIRPPHWYEYYDEARVDELQRGLVRMFGRTASVSELAKRTAGARSGQELMRALRYAQRKRPFVTSPRPAVIKDPFMAFSAATLQQKAGLKVVLCVRHPGAFAESFLRKSGQFDFRHLAGQPALLEKLPRDAAAIKAFAADPPSPEEQAALLWRVVYGFAASHLLADPRTCMIRQEDLAAAREATIDGLFAFAGATAGRDTARFVERNFTSGPADHEGRSYIARDPEQAAGKWRERLGRQAIETVRALTGPLARDFGYVDASWPH
ncbi:hypothetical protein [Erythrobacter litoralis]|uniref:Sulfotransferase domain-containing protein n=1 Tax=Erythrobacter litoralis (strain HTCC2594) TaxID=314225 RepID=Q2N6T0_ERYLH|nr:hypothetical protein [Erythrobacter litoralis]ABC64611.1 hypothetical protein ELI_12595 [Erythrobacter litoralis HTCC2594]